MPGRLLGRMLGADGACAARRVFLGLLPTSVPAPEPADADRARRRVERALGLALSDQDEGFARRAVGALVAAARAGGHVPASAGDDDLPDPADSLLLTELRRPPMMDHFTYGLRNRGEMALLYALSALVADPADPQACHYLRMLSARLGLERAVTGRLEAGRRRGVPAASVS